MKRHRNHFRKPRACRRQGGFTLLEVIVTIVIAAIMGVFFAQFVSTSVIHSTDPVKQLQYLYGGRDAVVNVNVRGVTSIMEYMTADYKRLAATQSNFLSIFKDYVGYGNTTTKPSGYEGYPNYGTYEVLCNKYVRFNASGVEENDPDQLSGRVLKVTIRRGDQAVTALFTR
jgi:prepilin-type N-terminal cleavage/methylation domain-containing protein